MRWMLEGGVLSEGEIERVVSRALDILDAVGFQIENDWIQERLLDYGARRGATTVTFPRPLMEAFLRESARVSGADADVSFGGSAEIYQGFLLDPGDGQYKPWTMDTLGRYVSLAQSLKHVRGASMLGMPAADGPLGPQPLTEKLVCWSWGVAGGSAIWDTSLCPAIYRMWNAWGEGTGEDARRAFNGTVYLISPLRFAHEEAAQYEWFARQGWEVHVGSLGSLGGTTPVTPAGALALQLAEGLFLQLLRRCVFGHRDLHLGNSLSVIDMQTGAFQYGRPEQTLLNMAGAQIARYLGASFGGHGGLTDARVPGYESAAQKISSAVANGFASGYGNIAAGLLAVDEVFSPEQLLLDDEMLGYLRRLSRGIGTEEEDFALEAIREAGPGGLFLDKEHTFEHFRQALWFPRFFSTESYGMWRQRGARDDLAETRARAEAAFASAPRPERHISAALEEKLKRIIQESY